MKTIYPNPVMIDRICDVFYESGLNQTEIGNILGVDRKTVGKYCNGYSCPNAEIIRKICIYFKVDADYLLGLK